MRIAAICCTYKRPEYLEHAIESFLKQDYPAHLRSMIILDDAGQYTSQQRDGWTLVSVPTRFVTMGEKRNAAAALAGDVDAYCPWDDDDIYLPWHMSAAVAALDGYDCTIPSKILRDVPPGVAVKPNGTGCHAAWCFRRELIVKVRGYPFIQSGQDQALLKLFYDNRFKRNDPLKFDPRPSFIYRWWTTHKQHLSDSKRMTYEQRAAIPFKRVTTIRPHWDRDWVQLCEKAMAATVAVA